MVHENSKVMYYYLFLCAIYHFLSFCTEIRNDSMHDIIYLVNTSRLHPFELKILHHTEKILNKRRRK